MPIQFFDAPESSTNDNDFYGDWIAVDTQKKLKKPVPYPVVEILRAKSGKGYMVQTTDFNCWLWNKSSIAKQLIEALEVYVKNGGYELIVLPVSHKPDGYKIGCDKSKSLLWYSDGKKYSTSEIPEELIKETEGNMFL